jgi:putative Mn2+ efflux pump MntP
MNTRPVWEEEGEVPAMLWKLAVVILTLGLDNLVLSTALGSSGWEGRAGVRPAVVAMAGLMPLIGMAAGREASAWFGQWSYHAGILALLGIGVYVLMKDSTKGIYAWNEEKGDKAFASAAFFIRFKELAIAFSFGLLNFPYGATLAVLLVQAVLFSVIGMVFGTALRPYVGKAAEKLAGGVLLATVVLIAVEHWFSR